MRAKSRNNGEIRAIVPENELCNFFLAKCNKSGFGKTNVLMFTLPA